jgi:hypothetical protein
VSLHVPLAYSSNARRTRFEIRAFDRFKQLAFAHSREAERGTAAWIGKETPLLFVAAPDVAREPRDVGGVGDRLETLELVGVDVARDQVVGAEDDGHSGRGEAAAVRVGVLDVAREPARVVAEQHIERARLGVTDHSGEVRALQGVLAGH